jgi:hypothetical protein
MSNEPAARPSYLEALKLFTDPDGFYWSSYTSYIAWCRACTPKKRPDKLQFDRDYYNGNVHIAESRDPQLQASVYVDLSLQPPNPATQPDRLQATLAERKTQHGDFTDHAYCSQSLKIVLRDHLAARPSRGQPDLSHEQHEALEMILHKIGRIVAGDANHLDHWHDIAGYATIAAERIK